MIRIGLTGTAGAKKAPDVNALTAEAGYHRYAAPQQAASCVVYHYGGTRTKSLNVSRNVTMRKKYDVYYHFIRMGKV